MFLQANVFAQTPANQSAEWMRVQSDDGEFSVEVPADYGFFVDKTGFGIAYDRENYHLEEVKMFNSYREKTLISFESYKASKNALKVVKINDVGIVKASEIEQDKTATIGERFIIKTDKSYTIRHYLSSKNRIYILTASSRNGETAAMKRFLDSLVFKPATGDKSAADFIDKAVLFSALDKSRVTIDDEREADKKIDNQSISPPEKNAASPLQVLFRPRPAYTDVARMNNEKGVVKLRITFSQYGFVSRVGFLRSLNFGLDRQVFFAALRIKFLPPEKDGKPETVTRVIEYSFDIY